MRHATHARLTRAILIGMLGLGFVRPAVAQTGLLKLEKTDATTVVFVDDNGNVMIVGKLVANNGTASGNYSVALGANTIASGGYATATGNETTASGLRATAMGYQSTASNASSVALGYQANSSGYGAYALGYQSTASGDFGAMAMGSGTMASGIVSTSMGYQTTASGEYSATMGRGTTAQAQASLALGRWNVIEGSPTSWEPTDPVLVVGNGTEGARANAFTLQKNGNLTIAGTLTENSDVRLKEDIEPLTDVLQRLEGIQGVSFQFRDAAAGPSGRQIGLLAQEVQQAFPELVREDAAGQLSVAYGNFTGVLLAAIQEQQREIEALRERLATLEARLQQ